MSSPEYGIAIDLGLGPGEDAVVDLRSVRGVRPDQREVHDVRQSSRTPRPHRCGAERARARRGGGQTEGGDMAALTMKELLEAGVHFGHQTKRWNPKMQKYIFGERNGIYIIDLQKTLKKFREAYAFVRDLAAGGGTRPLRRAPRSRPRRRCSRRPSAVRDVLREPALAGRHAHQLHHHPQVDRPPQAPRGDAGYRASTSACPRRRRSSSSASARSSRRLWWASRPWSSCPSAVFIVDPRKESIAVAEAQRLGISDRRHRRHQLRSHRHRSSHPRQRRRHPRRAPDHLADRRRHQRGPGHARQGGGEARGRRREGAGEPELPVAVAEG